MAQNDVLIDSFDRVKSGVHSVLNGLTVEDLTYRPNNRANSIAWLIWHLTRIQDDHVADLAHTKQIWEQIWFDKFNLPFEIRSTGYGHKSEDVDSVRANADILKGYYDDVHKFTINFISKLNEKDYLKIVDKRWDPPVTMAVRIVSIISDDLQHVGQAAYIKGSLLK